MQKFRKYKPKEAYKAESRSGESRWRWHCAGCEVMRVEWLTGDCVVKRGSGKRNCYETIPQGYFSMHDRHLCSGKAAAEKSRKHKSLHRSNVWWRIL
jgi:hypothetical protein